MQAVKEMQVMGLMLNRCDSMLVLVEIQRQRAGAAKSPFLASHNDSATKQIQ